MAYDETRLVNLGQLEELARRSKAAIEAAAGDATAAFKSGTVSGNTVSFYTTADHSGTAAFTFNFPEEMFLDQANTKFEESFAWTAAKYPGSTNPNLDGKPVMVLAVKTEGTTPAVNYSFLDMTKLTDVYGVDNTDGDGSATISMDSDHNFSVNVNIKNDPANILQKDATGALYVNAPSTSDKADKVASATAGNFAGLDASGNLTDSGSKAADFVPRITAVSGNVVSFGADGTITDSGIAASAVLTQHQDISGKADKVANAVSGNFAALDASGNLVDSGHKHSDYITQHQDISGKADKIVPAAAGNVATLGADGNLLDGGATVAQLTNVIEGVQVDGVDLTVTNKKVNVVISGKMDKVSGAVTGNIATYGANGQVVDSGITMATDTEVNEMLDSIFPSGD